MYRTDFEDRHCNFLEDGGHVSRKGVMINAYKFFVGKHDGNKPLGNLSPNGRMILNSS
jgi:hypothetical protein